MEELIHEEILQLFNKLDNQINLPLSMSLIYNVSVVNALWTIISGTRQGLLKGRQQTLGKNYNYLKN